jgi:hypothetical protein
MRSSASPQRAPSRRAESAPDQNIASREAPVLCGDKEAPVEPGTGRLLLVQAGLPNVVRDAGSSRELA